MLMQSALASARDRLCSRSHRAKLSSKNVGIFSVVMDGACKGAFPLIRGKYPHIQCFTCPAHGLDGFIKNICVSKQEIQMQRNEMGGVGVQHVSWDEDFFEKAFAQAWQCIQAVTATSIKHLSLVMITSLRCWNTLNNKISKECVQRERKRQRGTHFFFEKNN